MTVVFPRDASTWYGKVWLTAHGRGRSFNEGNLPPWDRNLDPAVPLRDLDKYDRLILAKGYALVKTYRSTPAAPPDVPRTNSTQSPPKSSPGSRTAPRSSTRRSTIRPTTSRTSAPSRGGF